MGFNVEWVAATDTTVEDFAAFFGFGVGDEIGAPDGIAIAQIGGWTLLYSSQGQVLSDERVAEFSNGRTAVSHLEAGPVVYARTFEYEDGKLVREAVVDRGKADDDVVETVGHADEVHERLVRLNRELGGESVSEELSRMAQKVVGYRIDTRQQPTFRALTGDSSKPATVFERLEDWLISEGFQPDHVERHVEKTFHRFAGNGFYITVLVGHVPEVGFVPKVSVGNEAFGSPDDKPQSRMSLTVSGRGAMDGKPGRVAGMAVAEDPFVGALARTKKLLAQAESRCSYKAMFEFADPAEQVLIARHQGWVELEAYAAAHVASGGEGSPAATSFDLGTLPVSLSRKSAGRLRKSLLKAEDLTSSELATIQAAGGPVTEACAALWFGHWKRAALFPDLNPEILLYLLLYRLTLGEQKIGRGQPSLFESVFLDETIQVRLLDDGCPVRHGVAANPSLTAENQMLAAERRLWTVGRNPNITDEVQTVLVESSREARDLFDLAANERVLPELVPVIAKSKNYRVRENLAKNRSKNIPTEVLVGLSKDQKKSVKWLTFPNPNLPRERQVEIAATEDDPSQLASNPKLCFEAQRLLVGKLEDFQLSKFFERDDLHPRLLVEWTSSDDVTVADAAARHPKLPQAQVIKLASEGRNFSRVAIASRSDLSDGTLNLLLADDDPEVRTAMLSKQLWDWASQEPIDPKITAAQFRGIARAKPTTVEKLAEAGVITDAQIEEHGTQIVSMVERALDAAPAGSSRQPAKHTVSAVQEAWIAKRREKEEAKQAAKERRKGMFPEWIAAQGFRREKDDKTRWLRSTGAFTIAVTTSDHAPFAHVTVANSELERLAELLADRCGVVDHRRFYLNSEIAVPLTQLGCPKEPAHNATFEVKRNFTAHLISEAEKLCDYEAVFATGDPVKQVLVEILQGWTARGEQAIKGFGEELSELIRDAFNLTAPASEESPRQEGPVAGLRERMLAGDHSLTAAELAAIQADGGELTETATELMFSYWKIWLKNDDIDPEVMLYVMQRRLTPEQFGGERTAITAGCDCDICFQLGELVVLPESIQSRLIASSTGMEWRVAMNPSFTPESQMQIAEACMERADRRSLRALAHNPNIAAEVQRTLLTTREGMEVMAGSPHLLPECIPVIEASGDKSALFSLAYNSTGAVPVETIVKHSKSRVENVRSAASQNPLLPEKRQKQMAAFADSSDLHRNPNLCLEAQQILLVRLLQETDANEGRAREFLFNDSLRPQVLAEYGASEEPIAIGTGIKHPNMPLEIVAKFASHPDPEVRKVIASRLHLPDEIRQQMMADVDATVRDASLTQQMLEWAIENDSAVSFMASPATGLADNFIQATFTGHLRAIAKAKPRTLEEFAKSDLGVPYRTGMYGPAFLELIETAVEAAPQ